MFQMPEMEEDQCKIEDKFLEKWNFPQCLGALDGRCPVLHRMLGLRIKLLGFHSIVLFTFVDANYKFLNNEMRAPGRVGDATIWKASNLKRTLEGQRLCELPERALPRTDL